MKDSRVEGGAIMQFIFADDSRQATPTRAGMDSPLVAVGGIFAPSENVRTLERGLETLCATVGFPPGEPFKWSPGRELWMYSNLVGEERQQFYLRALNLLDASRVTVVVVIEDTGRATATGAPTHESDTTILFLERVDNYLRFSSPEGLDGVVIADRPGGGRPEEEKFLLGCLETLREGTDYVKPERIVVNVLSTPARFVRLLQAADLVTACTLAFVSGEARFSPPIFAVVERMLQRGAASQIGGVGLKIHPDLRYGNLYHWLLGDDHVWRGGFGTPLPFKEIPYSTGPDRP